SQTPRISGTRINFPSSGLGHGNRALLPFGGSTRTRGVRGGAVPQGGDLMTLTNWTSSRRDFLRVSGAAVGMGVLPAAAETVGPAIVQTPGGPDRPNIVVVVIDTLRRDHVRS